MSKIFESHSVFDLGKIDEHMTLLYAPLSDNCVVVSEDDLAELEAAAEGKSCSREHFDVFNMLKTCSPIHRICKPADFINLSVLPTNMCNFSCTYCYSAKGRSFQTIDYDVVENAIRWFVGLERDGSPDLNVTFFGGGEPMLCWREVVKPAMDFIVDLRKTYVGKIRLTLITNGSVIPEGFAEFCRNVGIDLAISFEILPELQNTQRRNYNLVMGNIRVLCRQGIVPAINSVITDFAVDKMPQMVEWACENIPGVRHLSFEPVTGFHTDGFYDIFTEKFFESRNLAQGKGVNLTTSALRNCDVTVERYCAGELALTANGDITACPCVSSVQQPGYDRWVYGHANGGGVRINDERFKKIFDHDVNVQPWCSRCFARYNCGGGCLNKTMDLCFKPDVAYCRFFRNFLRRVLIERING